MLPTEPKVGWVFRYSYLWHWQHLEGREEGDKDRPALVLALLLRLRTGRLQYVSCQLRIPRRLIPLKQSKSRLPPSAAWVSMTSDPGLC